MQRVCAESKFKHINIYYPGNIVGYFPEIKIFFDFILKIVKVR